MVTLGAYSIGVAGAAIAGWCYGKLHERAKRSRADLRIRDIDRIAAEIMRRKALVARTPARMFFTNIAA